MKKNFILLLAIFSLIFSQHSQAAPSKNKPLILFVDAQTQNWVETIAKPLVKKAQLEDLNIKFYLVKSSAVNAFVTPDNNMYIHTGLISRAESSEEVLGVIAHELGHIKAQHLTKAAYHNKSFSVPAIIGGILGVGAAVAGNSEAASALIVGGQAAAITNMLQFSRTHERQADGIAATLLNNSGYSTSGLLSFFEKMRGDQLLYSTAPPPYLVTHPLPTERVNTVRDHYNSEQGKFITINNDADFKLIQAKIFSFSNSLGRVTRKYMNNTDKPAQLALTIVEAIKGNTQKSLNMADAMLKNSPNSPYLNELRAQITLDTGNLKLANQFFNKALKLAPNNSLIRIQLAQNLIAEGKNEVAIPHLLRLTTELPEWHSVQHMLGIAYGKSGKLGLSHLYLAEEALLNGDKKNAKIHLNTAQQKLAKDSKYQSKLTLLLQQLEEK